MIGGIFTSYKRKYTDEVILASRLPWKEYGLGGVFKCEIRNSPGKGKGVFAAEDIKKNGFITFYPGDGFVDKRADPPKTYTMVEVDIFASRGYHHRIDWGYIIGDSKKIDDPAYLGHMINDGASISKPENLEMYKKVSRLKLNANIVELYTDGVPHVGVMSTRDIPRGEEIFVSYGEDYWMIQLIRLNKHPGIDEVDGDIVCREDIDEYSKECVKKIKAIMSGPHRKWRPLRSDHRTPIAQSMS